MRVRVEPLINTGLRPSLGAFKPGSPSPESFLERSDTTLSHSDIFKRPLKEIAIYIPDQRPLITLNDWD